MLKNQIFDIMNNHPIFHLATCEGSIPHVRHMMLYRADENGIIFHTSFDKDVCQQILENSNVELCFYSLKYFIQIRVSGNAIVVHDNDIKKEIIEHPSRQYLSLLKSVKNQKEFFDNLVVFKVIKGKALIWTIQGNYDETKKYAKNYIDLY